MSELSVDYHEDVAVLRFGSDENRIDGAFLAALGAALDAVLARPEARALVTRGSERFFCNGYDLAWLAALSLDDRRAFIRDQQAQLARVLTFPLPTVAALTGHAFGAGCLLALAHDVRVLDAARGDLCLPEIDARIPLRRAMWALLEARLSPSGLRDVALTGRRFGGQDAVSAGLVQELAPTEALVGRAVELAIARSGKPRETLARLKEDAHAEAARGLRGKREAPGVGPPVSRHGLAR